MKTERELKWVLNFQVRNEMERFRTKTALAWIKQRAQKSRITKAF